jgi:hypothetical protein
MTLKDFLDVVARHGYQRAHSTNPVMDNLFFNYTKDGSRWRAHWITWQLSDGMAIVRRGFEQLLITASPGELDNWLNANEEAKK